MVWRPYDIGYEPPEDYVDAEESERVLGDIRQHALRDSVLAAILPQNKREMRSRVQELKDRGLIDENMTQSSIRNAVHTSFEEFFVRDAKLPERWKRHLFFETARWLVSSGVLRLNTCRDWLVDRSNPAERLGLKNFPALEQVLWRTYGGERLHHLHSGSGDNSGVYRANKDGATFFEKADGERVARNEVWDHVGFGNKLYAPIETMLGQFLKEGLRDETMHPKDPTIQIVVRILTEALQKKLHERWHSPNRGVTEHETWSDNPHQDFNEIFRLLRNPRELLEGINLPHAVPIHLAKYQLSGRFTGDLKIDVSDPSLTQLSNPKESQRIALEAYRILMELSGMSERLIAYELVQYQIRDEEATAGRLGRYKSQFKKIERMLEDPTERSDPHAAACSLENLITELSMHLEPSHIANIEACTTAPLRVKAALAAIDETHETATLHKLGAPEDLSPYKDLATKARRLRWEWAQPQFQAASNAAESRRRSFEALLDDCRATLSRDEVDALQSLGEEVALDALIDSVRKRKENQLKGPTLTKAEDALLPEDRLQRKFQMLKVIRQELLRLEKQSVGGKLLMMCNETLGGSLHGLTAHKIIEMVDSELASMEARMTHADVAEGTERMERVLRTFFEPEFVNAVMMKRTEQSHLHRHNDFKLIDTNAMDERRKYSIKVHPDSIVRANDNIVTGDISTVSGTDFLIHRDGDTVTVDGSAVSPDAPRIQAAFALEITADLDLNERPYAYPRNFVPGNFENIADLLPPESFMLTSAVRSDSHIDDASFIGLTADYIKLLKPGGCLVTDGIEESYSQVLRLVSSLPSDVARIEIVMSAKTHRPISLFVQKAHPNGYLSDNEKREAFKEDVYFRPPEDIANLRPDLEIQHDVLREIRELFGYNAFQALEGQLDTSPNIEHERPSRFQERLIAAAAGQLLMKKPNLVDGHLHHFITRNLWQRNGQMFKEGKGTLIGDPQAPIESEADLARVVPEIHALRLQTVTSIIDLLTRVMRPIDPTSETLRGMERAVVEAIVDRCIIGDAHLRPIGVPERRQAMKGILDLGRNVDYDRSPILSQWDVNYIQRSAAGRARREIQKQEAWARGESPREADGWIRSFTRRDVPWELPRVRTTILNDNAEYATPEAADRLRGKEDRLRTIATRLRDVTGHPPISFLHFTDCVTNDMLLERLREIFGPELGSIMNDVSCTFTTREGAPIIERADALKRQINGWNKSKNRLILGGGSWTDTFDLHGALLKNLLGQQLVNFTMPQNNVRELGICYYSQMLGDTMGGVESGPQSERTHTRPGPLEIGLAGITPTGRGRDHPLFADCGPCTVAMTRGGHLMGDNFHENSRHMQILARSDAAGTAAAWSAMNDAIIGIQFHPEVRLVEKGRACSSDSERILEQLERHAYALRDRFECDVSDLAPNFDVEKAKVAGNAGDEILVNALLFQLSEIERNLRD